MIHPLYADIPIIPIALGIGVLVVLVLVSLVAAAKRRDTQDAGGVLCVSTFGRGDERDEDQNDEHADAQRDRDDGDVCVERVDHDGLLRSELEEQAGVPRGHEVEAGATEERADDDPVSYTHLTLPTIYSV